jgi:hypothetical protein
MAQDYPRVEARIRNIVQEYAELGKNPSGYPPHRLACTSGAQLTEQLTVPAWQFDSDTALHGGMGPGQTGMESFAGCFQPEQTPDIPVPPLCLDIGLGFEVCFDPPPMVDNCCGNEKELLSKGGLNPAMLAIPIAAFRWDLVGVLGTFIGEGCNVPEDRRNLGYKMNFWWPENEIEIHNYGRTVFDPTFECGNQHLTNAPLIDFLKTLKASLTKFQPAGSDISGSQNPVMVSGREAGIPDELRYSPHIGNTHWAGIQPGDEVFSGEAHLYRTYLNTLTALNHPGDSTWLGYKRDCRCFYSALDSQLTSDNRQRKIVNGWTEDGKYLPFWRYYQNSLLINENKYEAILKYSSFYRDSCAFLRAWEPALGRDDYKYVDLHKAVGIWPPPPTPPRLRNELLRICYKGGGDLFPITGQLIGQFNPLQAGAYLSRRALYLFGIGALGSNNRNRDGDFVPNERRINRYSDRDDKIQRIYPLKDSGMNGKLASRCFRGHEIPNYLQEEQQRLFWPSDLLEDALRDGPAGPLDSPRYLYWNKRQNCMCPYIGKALGLKFGGNYIACRPAGPACALRDNGDLEDDDRSPIQGFNSGHAPQLNFMPGSPVISVGTGLPVTIPDGIPYPFLPKYGEGVYSLDPVRVTDPAIFQPAGSPRAAPGGRCELNFNRGMFKLHRRLPEHLINQFGQGDGGLRCNPPYPRCTPSFQQPN